MKRGWGIPGLLISVLVVAACTAPTVFQGKVVSYDARSKSLVVANQLSPDQIVIFSTRGADVGAEPAPGDIVRLAYKEQGGEFLALRVMNLSKQKELAGQDRKK
jgi:hypothetical protein